MASDMPEQSKERRSDVKTELEELLGRLKDAQRELLVAAARAGTLPSDGALRKIADIEVTIGAVEALLEERERS
jgi:hypothetical protein